MAAPRLTPNQRDVLVRLCRWAGEPPGRWTLDRDLGQRSALEHLWSKGYADRERRYGPRGGEHLYYRPTEEGWAVFVRQRDRLHLAERKMTTGEIDSRLIDARDNGKIVRVYVGENMAEFRGIPGEVERDEAGALRLRFGARRLLLSAIREVTD